ncbi:MAG: hypothetical protein ACYCZD_01875 [Rhodanobacter sp.]
MDGSSRIALAILAAALLLVLGFVGYREFSRQRDMEQGAAVMQQILDSGRDMDRRSASAAAVMNARTVAESRAVEQHRQDLVVQAWARRRLASDQRCVGDVVVQVDGSMYTQLGSITNPVHCSGLYADRPIR